MYILLVSTVDAKAFTGVGISVTCELKILRILQLKEALGSTVTGIRICRGLTSH